MFVRSIGPKWGTNLDIVGAFLEYLSLFEQNMGVPLYKYDCFHHFWEDLELSSRQQIDVPLWRNSLFPTIIESILGYVSLSRNKCMYHRYFVISCHY